MSKCLAPCGKRWKVDIEKVLEAFVKDAKEGNLFMKTDKTERVLVLASEVVLILELTLGKNR